MQHGIGFEIGKRLGEGRAVGDIGAYHLRCLARDRGDPVGHICRCIEKAVEDLHLVPGLKKADHRVAADIPCSAGDSHAHDLTLPLLSAGGL